MKLNSNFIKKWFRFSDLVLLCSIITIVLIISFFTESISDIIATLAFCLALSSCYYSTIKDRKEEFKNRIKVEFKLKYTNEGKPYINIVNLSSRICHIASIGLRSVYSIYDEDGKELQWENVKNKIRDHKDPKWIKEAMKESYRVINDVIVNYSKKSNIKHGAQFPFDLDLSKRLSVFNIKNIDITYPTFEDFIDNKKIISEIKYFRIVIEQISGQLIESQKINISEMNGRNRA